MDQTQDNKIFEDLARGTLYGALCGDSIGSYVEFQSAVSSQESEEALLMKGGGPFDIGAGQITDDGELALCLGLGLVEGNGKLDLNLIAKRYLDWLRSPPFDCGITIGTALRGMRFEQTEFAKACRNGALGSKSSQSNGALMRIAPMCIWSAHLSMEDLIKCVREETRLTHPNQTALDVSVAYVYTIQHLLNNKGDSDGAYQKAKEMVAHLKNSEIEGWIHEMEKGKLPVANDKMGWVKIAFCYALHFMKNKTSYRNAMKTMLEQGGDTDTNCCIVGAMLGALHGFEQIPKEFTDKVRKFDPAACGGIDRPDFLLAAKCADKIIEGIIAILPKEAVIEAAETEGESKK